MKKNVQLPPQPPVQKALLAVMEGNASQTLGCVMGKLTAQMVLMNPARAVRNRFLSLRREVGKRDELAYCLSYWINYCTLGCDRSNWGSKDGLWLAVTGWVRVGCARAYWVYGCCFSLQNGKQRNGAEAVTVKDLLPMAHFLTSEFPGPRGPTLPRIALLSGECTFKLRTQ